MFNQEVLKLRSGGYAAIDEHTGPFRPKHQTVSAAARTDRLKEESHMATNVTEGILHVK